MSTRKNRASSNLRRVVLWLLVFALLLSACDPGELQVPLTPTPAPTLTLTLAPEATPQATPEPSPTPAPTMAPAPACTIERQMQAVRDPAGFDFGRLEPLTCYDLSLTLSAAARNTYTGTAQVTFTNPLEDALPDLVFRTYASAPAIFGGSLVISNAQVNGTPVDLEVLENGTAYRLVLPEPLPPGGTLTAALEFAGRTPVDFGAGGIYGTFNLSTAEPLLSLASWYPVLAALEGGSWQLFPAEGTGDVVVSEIALYRVLVDTPSDWQIAATGVLASSTPGGERVTHEYLSGPVRDFMIVASPVFEPEERQHGDITLTHWRLPGITYDDTVFTVAERSLDLFGELFGPYPYTTLDIVDMPLQNASGVEYPALIILATNLYSDPSRRDFLPTVVTHEVAHQWWYAVVGNDVNRHPWQDEGLTTYSALLYHERYDPDYYRGTIEFYRQRVAEYEQEQGPQAIGQPVSNFAETGRGYAIVVYYKGALFFADLREQIGDEAFFAALASYYTSARYRIVPPELLLNAFERACRCDLSGLYRSYGVIGR